MKIIVLLLLFLSFTALAQPPINERYTIGYDATIFGSVMANDSCYYVLGMGANQSGNQFQEGAWLRFNFDGTIHSQSMYTNDTLEIILWESPNLIQTLDSNFATFGVCNTNYPGGSYNRVYLFIKLKPNGDTLFTSYLNQFYENDNNLAITASQFFQNSDSTYTCIANVSNINNAIGKTVLFKLSKHGELLWHKYFSGLSATNYRILKSQSLIKYDTNKILIGGAILEVDGYNEDIRMHVKLIMTDTLGNLLWQRTYFEDTLSPRCFSLTKTTDGGVLYCGRDGVYNIDGLLGLDYKSHITKLDANFDVEWRLHVGGYHSEDISFRNILALNDSEFVVVGNTSVNYDTETHDAGFYGWLVKFNINGELLWDRKYINVPHVSATSVTYAKHVLYDVALTKDSGFVMVGQARKYAQNNLPGPPQQGWLVKVDKHGCLVPNCQQYDNVDTTDTTIVQPPIVIIPQNVLYPNPANTSLYYYHVQADTSQQQTAYMYNLQGKLVQQFGVNENNLTYIINVTNFASGVYAFVIKNELGEVLRSEKIVVQH